MQTVVWTVFDPAIAVLSSEFYLYNNISEELRIPGAVPDCDRAAVQDIIMQECDLMIPPSREVLPYLVVRKLTCYDPFDPCHCVKS